MVSRRSILSRSISDDPEVTYAIQQQEKEEDVWYHREKLCKDHIQEVLNKWTQIDDEIWSKVIVLERNRRVAKLYARAPVLTVNGSDERFDGFRIGLCSFDNPMRDPKTDELKKHVGHGVKIKMDDQGNILIKRVSKCNVYVKSSSAREESSIGNDILKLPNCSLEMEMPVKLFDMKKFQQIVNRELRQTYPDRRQLETQCLSAIAFVKNEPELLDCPIWVLIINVIAMDMLKSKLPPVKHIVDMRNRPRIPVPDEDPYSVAGSGGSSGKGSNNTGGIVAATRELLQKKLLHRRSDKPPKLPPRDNSYPHDIPKPDYDDIEEENGMKTFTSSRSGNKTKDNKTYEDPYYFGMRARVPNFVTRKMSAVRGPPSASTPQPFNHGNSAPPQQYHNGNSAPPQPYQHGNSAPPQQYQHGNSVPPHQYHNGNSAPPQHPAMWQAKSYGNDIDSSPYNHIYGRVMIPTRTYIPQQNRAMFIGEWE